MKNFHWGKAIAIFFVVYIIILISVVIKSRSVDHALVTDDYYAQDLDYQKHYQMKANQIQYYPGISMIYRDTTRTVEIDWKSSNKSLHGKLQLYRASNEKKDQLIEVTVTPFENRSMLPVSHLSSGKWSGLLTWTDGEREYYYEDSFYVVML